jgi:hypothetical protein
MMKLVSKVLAQASEAWTKIAGICYTHWCPGCKQMHLINIEKPNRLGAIWSFDGNLESPTFNPSVNHVGSCHYFIRSGQIAYCSDSKHEFSGQTIPLPDFPEDMI